MTAFDSVASYYEVLSDSAARIEREGPLLAQWLQTAPGGRVWDLACGTGLHAEYLAGLGADVLATDAAAEMIRHARQRRPHERIQYQVADMRDLPDASADLVVCLGNSLNLLPAIEQAQAVVVEAATRLAPGGLFCAQVVNNAAKDMDQPRYRVELKETDRGQVVAVKALVPLADKTLLSLSFFHESGGVWKSAADTAVLLHLSLSDFQAAAQKAGLRIADVFGGFDKREFDAATSPDLIVTMAK
jgi:SAM-dependent methyltransferase